jgi:DNA-binding protein H-NS
MLISHKINIINTSKNKIKRKEHPKMSTTKLPNLENLTIEELITLQSEIEKQIKKTQRAGKRAVLKQMDEMAKAAGYGSAAEMVAGGGRAARKDKGTKAPPMYKDPNSEKTWSGKGRVPGWMVDYEKKKGKKRDDLLIEK